MADGTTSAISDVEVGDLVAARDPETDQATAQPVLSVIVGHGNKHLIEVVTLPVSQGGTSEASNTNLTADRWTATGNHPIWVEGDDGWTQADDLAVGDLLQGATGQLRIVQDLEDHGWLPGQTVYNLSVGNVHTFVVGWIGDGSVVHNCGYSSSDAMAEPKALEGLTPSQVDDLARNAGYNVLPGNPKKSNPATRYFRPGTKNSVGVRVLPRGVPGQPGVKSGPYLKFVGGRYNDKRVELR